MEVAIVFDRMIQYKTFFITWADVSAIAMVATVLWVFELKSLAVFDRAFMVVYQLKYHSRPS